MEIMNGKTLTTRLKERYATYLSSFIFGVEDSLVSTVGLISGVAVAGTTKETIVLAGVVLIFVEAFSMGAGNLLSENVEEEFKKQAEVPMKKSIMPGVIMFVSYFLAGFIPIAPYIFFSSISVAFWVSIALALVALFVLGVISAKMSSTAMVRHGFEMLIIGGMAIGLGVLIGKFVSSL